jgi:hypothetical protein
MRRTMDKWKPGMYEPQPHIDVIYTQLEMLAEIVEAILRDHERSKR